MKGLPDLAERNSYVINSGLVQLMPTAMASPARSTAL